MRLAFGLFILFVVTAIEYVRIDNTLYYYGRGHFDREGLPLGIKPEDRPAFEGGFGLRDQYGISIAAKGNAYKNGNEQILIDWVVSYCWDEKRLMAVVRNENDNEFMLEFKRKTETMDEIIAQVHDASERSKFAFKGCYELNDNVTIGKLMRRRGLCISALLVLVIAIIWRSVWFFRTRV